MATDDQLTVKSAEQAEEEFKAAQRKYKKQVESLKAGTKHLVLRKRRSENTVTLTNGTVVRASPGVKTLEGASHEKLLDWADRCRVQVFMSPDGRKAGELVAAPLQMPQL